MKAADSRVRFKAPTSLISEAEAKEPRVILREALLLALASDSPDVIIESQEQWFEDILADGDLRDIRIRIYDIDIVTKRVARYSQKERSLILAYGLHLRSLVLDQYVPLANRRPRDEVMAPLAKRRVHEPDNLVVREQEGSAEATGAKAGYHAHEIRAASLPEQAFTEDQNIGDPGQIEAQEAKAENEIKPGPAEREAETPGRFDDVERPDEILQHTDTSENEASEDDDGLNELKSISKSLF